MGVKAKKFTNAAAVIKDGVQRKQTDKQIKARVRRAFPDYASLEKVRRWACNHPEWVAGKYAPGKNGKKKAR